MMGSILILQQIKLRFLLKGKANRPRMKRIQRLAKKYNCDNTIVFTDINTVQNKLDIAAREYSKQSSSKHVMNKGGHISNGLLGNRTRWERNKAPLQDPTTT